MPLPSPLTVSVRALSCSPKQTEPLGGQVKCPSPAVPLSAQARFWAVLWHPFTTGPTVSTTCTSYSLIFGVSHTQGERQPRDPPSPSRVHTQPPLSTPDAKPEYLRARCQTTADSPEACRNYWKGQVSSCAPCPALPLPHRPPAPGLPRLPTSTGSGHGSAVQCGCAKSQD